jgi:hypothetical protein
MWPFGKQARHGEQVIASYVFPAGLASAVEPRASKAEWPMLVKGLREWFICWVHRRHHQLWLPSRAVDGAWVAFMADEAAYDDFCGLAFGKELSHSRDPLRDDTGRAMFETVFAWDRSDAAKRGDSVLWSLDEQLGVEAPLGISAEALEEIRSNDDPRYGGPYMYGAGDTGGVAF